MTEEINHSCGGGLYAELIRNRIFKDDGKKPAYWSVSPNKEDSALISLDNDQHINDSLTVCLKLDAGKASGNNRIGIANKGFWGVPVRPKTTYQVSFYAKTDAQQSGPLTVSLQDNNGKLLAQSQVNAVSGNWQK